MAERKNNPSPHIPGSAACGQWETLLPDALDGVLTPADDAIFQEHMAVCAACTALYEESRRGREWLEFLSPEPEVPLGLVEKILAQTGPGHEAGLPLGSPMPAGGVPLELLAIPKWQKPGFMGFVRRFAEPRLMMTGATAFFSIALTMNMLGVRVTSLRMSDLRPTAMRSFMERQLTMASVPIIRYYDHLRFVYEVESRVRELRGPATEGEGQSNGNGTQKNAQPAGGESRKNGGGGSRVDPPQRSGATVSGPMIEAALEQTRGIEESLLQEDEILGCGLDGRSFPSGAEARDHFAQLMYGLKPVPFKLTVYQIWKEEGLTHSGNSISGKLGRETRERGKPWIA
jgi:Putative zinc-finger